MAAKGNPMIASLLFARSALVLINRTGPPKNSDDHAMVEPVLRITGSQRRTVPNWLEVTLT